MRRRRLRVVALSALLVAAGAAVATPAWGSPIRLSTSTPLMTADVRESIEYLTQTYKIDQGEALRRLELQRTSAELNDVLASRFPETYAGMWLDQDRGGTLVVASTEPGSLGQALSAVPDRENVRVERVEHSLAELEAAASRVSERLGLTKVQAPSIDVVHNRVALYRDAAAIAQRSAAAALGADADLLEIPAAEDEWYLKACSIQNCGPPIRGGAKIYMFSSLNSPSFGAVCTNGFNIHGSNGWQYTVTAGHCFHGNLPNGQIYNFYYFDTDGHWVGERQSNYVAGWGNNYPVDAVIAPYVVTGGTNYAGYWLNGQPKNRVWSGSNSQFPITGYYGIGSIQPGWVACHTGGTSLNTRCGTVQAKDGGIIMNICTKGGDSGGPLFSQVDNKAYGVLHAGNNPNDNCPPGVLSSYSPLSSIFSQVTLQTGLTFDVNTS